MRSLMTFLLLAHCVPAQVADWHLWSSLMAEVSQLSTRGDFRAATPLAIRAVEQARLAGPRNGRLAESLSTLGFVYWQTGAYGPAERVILEAIAVSKALPNDQHRLVFAYDQLAMLYHETGRPAAEVESLHRRALDMAVVIFGPEAPEVGVLLSRLAVSLIARRKFNEAEVQLIRALQLTNEHRFPALTADMYGSLGTVAYHKGKYSEALEALAQADRLYRQAAGPGSPGFVSQLTSLGAVYLKMNRVAEADQTLEQAEQIATQVYGAKHPRVAEALSYRIQSLKKLGKRKEADQARARVREIVAAWRAEVNVFNSRVNGALTFKE